MYRMVPTVFFGSGFSSEADGMLMGDAPAMLFPQVQAPAAGKSAACYAAHPPRLHHRVHVATGQEVHIILFHFKAAA